MEVEELLKTARGLIFDCDGTLVDSMDLHMQAWEDAFKKHNAWYDEPFLSSLKGMKETDIISAYNAEFNAKLHPETVVADKHSFFELHIRKVKPVEKVVRIARQNYGIKPMAVVSGSVAEIVHKELKITGIYNLFRAIITASDPFKPKPDPECFLEAAQRISINPDRVLVFEDGDTGLEAARNAGMMTVDVRNFSF